MPIATPATPAPLNVNISDISGTDYQIIDDFNRGIKCIMTRAKFQAMDKTGAGAQQRLVDTADFCVNHRGELVKTSIPVLSLIGELLTLRAGATPVVKPVMPPEVLAALAALNAAVAAAK